MAVQLRCLRLAHLPAKWELRSPEARPRAPQSRSLCDSSEPSAIPHHSAGREVVSSGWVVTLHCPHSGGVPA